jgi:hypothetical protein
VVVVLLVVTLVFTGAVLALVRDGAQLRRRLERVERRLALCEIDAATSIAVEPEPQREESPPRRSPSLLN